MNRTQLAKAFAAQSLPRARASSLYFEGKVAFSYGEHFPLAVITGHKAATVNVAKYSSTTSRHQSTMRHALAAEGFTITEVYTDAMRELRIKAGRNG
ncbi:MAG: hypothetical protein KBG29_07875 [Pseudomonadales bacterium]|nr:hypothetical protein [Pseudomonadales bacterium]